MAYHRSPFGDTTLTKIFVGGLAWETPTEEMRRYFQQFGEILEAVIITDKNTGKSKGYGFVTFGDPESARKACVDPNPVIDGRRANCNVASLGRPRGRMQDAATVTPLPPPRPPLPPPPPLFYPPYGYSTYIPEYGYQQALYNSQVHHHHQLYGPSSSSSSMGSPYYYGYSLQPPRGTYSAPQPQRFPGPSYPYYPTTQLEGSFRHPYPSSTDSQTQVHDTTEIEAGAVTSETPKT